jgi:hypothetical protein
LLPANKTLKNIPLLNRKGALLIESQSSRRAGNCVVLRLVGLNKRAVLNTTKPIKKADRLMCISPSRTGRFAGGQCDVSANAVTLHHSTSTAPTAGGTAIPVAEMCNQDVLIAILGI